MYFPPPPTQRERERVSLHSPTYLQRERERESVMDISCTINQIFYFPLYKNEHEEITPCYP